MTNSGNNLQVYSSIDAEGRSFMGYVEIDNPERYICGSFAGYMTTKGSTQPKIRGEQMLSLLLSANRVFEILGYALKNTYTKWQHAEEYIGILEQNMTDEEYETAQEEYEEYSRKPRNLSSGEIAIASKLVLEAVGVEMSSDELSEVLNLDALAVEKALKAHAK